MAGASTQLLRTDIRVLHNNLLAATRWRRSRLVDSIREKGKVKVIFDDDLGVVDFCTTTLKIIYVTEADILTSCPFRSRVAKLRKALNSGTLVIVDNTSATRQYFSDIQKFVVIKLHMLLIPVENICEATQTLQQLVLSEGQSRVNPFRIRVPSAGVDGDILRTLLCVPGLGDTKARALLKHFKSLSILSAATAEDLASIIGRTSGEQLHRLLHH